MEQQTISLNDPKKWRTNVPNFRKVQFDNIYPGVFAGVLRHQRQLEHDFVVAPGADPKKIAMEIAGANGLSVETNGDLVIKTKRVKCALKSQWSIRREWFAPGSSRQIHTARQEECWV